MCSLKSRSFVHNALKKSRTPTTVFAHRKSILFAILSFYHLISIWSTFLKVLTEYLSSIYNVFCSYFHTEKWNVKCQYFNRSTVEGTIQDIHDASIYSYLKRQGEFFLVPEHTGLIICCDGIPVYESSGMHQIITFVFMQLLLSFSDL